MELKSIRIRLFAIWPPPALRLCVETDAKQFVLENLRRMSQQSLDKYAYSACKLNETAVQQQYTKIDSFQLARLRDIKDENLNKIGGRCGL